MTLPILLTIAAYVAGATPTSHWVGRGLYGTDLRVRGSGNLGATNVYRVLGWKAALPVVVVDVLKGWVPVAVFPALVPDAPAWWALAFGAAAIVGHTASFWVGFKGGKGVATSAGVFLAIAPLAVLAGLAVWLAAVVLTRYVSLGSILAALVLPPAVAVAPHRGGDAAVGFAVAMALFVVWAHRSNVRRLLRGEENRIARRQEEAV